MKRITLIVLFVAFVGVAAAQYRIDRTTFRSLNFINVTLLGDGSLTSFSYERHMVLSPNFFVTGQVGLGATEEILILPDPPPETYLTLPAHVTLNLGMGTHYVELGMGGTFLFGNLKQNYFLYPQFGYRYQPLKAGNMSFRIFFSYPLFGKLYTEDRLSFIPVGISLVWSLDIYKMHSPGMGIE